MSTPTIPEQSGAASAPAMGSAELKKPPFSAFVFRALQITPLLCLGIINITTRHWKSDVEFWFKVAVGVLLIMISLLRLLVSSWRLAVETMEMNKGDNPPNDKLTHGETP